MQASGLLSHDGCSILPPTLAVRTSQRRPCKVSDQHMLPQKTLSANRSAACGNPVLRHSSNTYRQTPPNSHLVGLMSSCANHGPASTREMIVVALLASKALLGSYES
eukprot:GHRR01033589.1.p2 GENE.GHRR01033589.1~~GHRR01033589.1.p2  ORF type:complete len:107 (-),score=4.92 GHRR01033589.1:169-489(-)